MSETLEEMLAGVDDLDWLDDPADPTPDLLADSLLQAGVILDPEPASALEHPLNVQEQLPAAPSSRRGPLRSLRKTPAFSARCWLAREQDLHVQCFCAATGPVSTSKTS